jgi:hypothetical protein
LYPGSKEEYLPYSRKKKIRDTAEKGMNIFQNLDEKTNLKKEKNIVFIHRGELKENKERNRGKYTS